MKLPVRIDGALTPPNTLYIMQNPLDRHWEIVVDAMNTYERHRQSGKLDSMVNGLVENGALPKEANES